MTTVAVEIDDHLTNLLSNSSINDHVEIQNTEEVEAVACENHHGICAICLNTILLQETALIKGCEHAYCVTCILQWAMHRKNNMPAIIHDYMQEESVCLLLRASWFCPLIVDHPEEPGEETFDSYLYEDQYDEDDEDDLNEIYLNRSPNLHIGNRRWGDNGFVRGGRQEARPVEARPAVSRQDSAGRLSRERKKKENKNQNNNLVKDAAVGRRAKRALKREAADKAAAAKHEQHLARFGRN